MLRFIDKLSTRQKYWLGFACCPLITWSSYGLLAYLIYIANDSWSLIPQNLSTFARWFIVIIELTYLAGAPLFSGFTAVLFWRQLKPVADREDMIGFWSICLSWAPAFALLLATMPWLFFFLLFPFMLFTLFYISGFQRGLWFWNSNYSRQWLGDFSDFS